MNRPRIFDRGRTELTVDLDAVQALTIEPDGDEERIVRAHLVGGASVVLFDSLMDGGPDKAQELFDSLTTEFCK